jgi:hypothetical protein
MSFSQPRFPRRVRPSDLQRYFAARDIPFSEQVDWTAKRAPSSSLLKTGRLESFCRNPSQAIKPTTKAGKADPSTLELPIRFKRKSEKFPESTLFQQIVRKRLIF